MYPIFVLFDIFEMGKILFQLQMKHFFIYDKPKSKQILHWGFHCNSFASKYIEAILLRQHKEAEYVLVSGY